MTKEEFQDWLTYANARIRGLIDSFSVDCYPPKDGETQSEQARRDRHNMEAIREVKRGWFEVLKELTPAEAELAVRKFKGRYTQHPGWTTLPAILLDLGKEDRKLRTHSEATERTNYIPRAQRTATETHDEQVSRYRSLIDEGRSQGRNTAFYERRLSRLMQRQQNDDQ